MNTKGDWIKFATGLALAALVSYYTTNGILQARVAVLEDRYDRLLQDVREIKADVKVLLRRERDERQ